MSEPEILRRCAICGAASRPGALFCPQCGNATPGRREGSGAAERQNAQEGPGLDPRLQTRKLDSTDATLQTRRLDSKQSKKQISRAAAEAAILKSESTQPQPDSPINVDGATPILPNALEDSIRPRGEEPRRVSSVVLDGAAYDPSIRFVLVAAILFVLFLVILMLSKVIT